MKPFIFLMMTLFFSKEIFAQSLRFNFCQGTDSSTNVSQKSESIESSDENRSGVGSEAASESENETETETEENLDNFEELHEFLESANYDGDCPRADKCEIKSRKNRLKFLSHKDQVVFRLGLEDENYLQVLNKLCRKEISEAFLTKGYENFKKYTRYKVLMAQTKNGKIRGIAFFHFPQEYKEPLQLKLDILCTGKEGRGFGKQMFLKIQEKLKNKMDDYKLKYGYIKLDPLKNAMGFYLNQDMQAFDDLYLRKVFHLKENGEFVSKVFKDYEAVDNGNSNSEENKKGIYPENDGVNSSASSNWSFYNSDQKRFGYLDSRGNRRMTDKFSRNYFYQFKKSFQQAADQ